MTIFSLSVLSLFLNEGNPWACFPESDFDEIFGLESRPFWLLDENAPRISDRNSTLCARPRKRGKSDRRRLLDVTLMQFLNFSSVRRIELRSNREKGHVSTFVSFLSLAAHGEPVSLRVLLSDTQHERPAKGPSGMFQRLTLESSANLA